MDFIRLELLSPVAIQYTNWSDMNWRSEFDKVDGKLAGPSGLEL